MNKRRIFHIPFSDSTSFYEILKEQLRERNLTEHQCDLVEYLIGSLDDDGLLRKSLESICDELAIYAGIESTEEELEEALNISDFCHLILKCLNKSLS